MKILNVVGARPNFMKIAPLMAAYGRFGGVEPVLVHTGQHYDERMSDLFFRELGIPEPDINLGIGSASHAVQTAEIMKAFEAVCVEHQPDVVVVVGDVNSTLATGLVAVKLGIPLAHVEAGLRSFDRRMPEEINRLLTDAISDLLFTTEPSAMANLKAEGIPAERVHFVGNVMIDTLLANLAKAEGSGVLDGLGLKPRAYAALTLHRAGNVDDPARLRGILDALDVIQQDLPIVFAAHPRTRKNLAASPLGDRVAAMDGLYVIDPMGYLDFLKLMASARLVLTDSGGIQEETTILQVPCLTLRENTERPVTVDVGCNQVVGTDPERILAAFRAIMAAEDFTCAIPEKWDGRAAERIAGVLVDALSS